MAVFRVAEDCIEASITLCANKKDTRHHAMIVLWYNHNHNRK